MSYRYIEGQKVNITEGPLKGLEGQISKIDRHKRQCIVEVDMFGLKTRMTVGLEIVEKQKSSHSLYSYNSYIIIKVQKW